MAEALKRVGAVARGPPVRPDVGDAHGCGLSAAPRDRKEILGEHGAAVEGAGFDRDVE